MSEIRPMEDGDRDRVALVTAQAFRATKRTADEVAHLPLDGSWVLSESGSIQAVVRAEPAGSWLGGRVVPAVTIWGVAVSAESRGRGYGPALLQEVLRHHGGFGLTVLFPTVTRPYRACGYELAGSRVQYRVPIDGLPKTGMRAVEPWQGDLPNDIRECYTRFAAVNAGLLDRTERHWRRVLHDESLITFGYRVREGRETTGYVLFTQRAEAGPPSKWAPGDVEYNHVLACRDLVWLGDEALRALLALLASDRALGRAVHWVGPPNDPLLSCMPAGSPSISQSTPWMARILDVGVALSQRGFPEDLTASLTIRVHDPIGRKQSWRIEVVHGKGDAEPTTAEADAEIDVGAMTALFTGFWSPEDAVRAGRLTGVSGSDIHRLGTLFRGPQPWMIDLF